MIVLPSIPSVSWVHMPKRWLQPTFCVSWEGTQRQLRSFGKCKRWVISCAHAFVWVWLVIMYVASLGLTPESSIASWIVYTHRLPLHFLLPSIKWLPNHSVHSTNLPPSPVHLSLQHFLVQWCCSHSQILLNSPSPHDGVSPVLLTEFGKVLVSPLALSSN